MHWIQKTVLLSLTIVAVLGAAALLGWAVKIHGQPAGITTINTPTDPSTYVYENQAAVCNSLRYMNVIIMDDQARKACRAASDGKPGPS